MTDENTQPDQVRPTDPPPLADPPPPPATAPPSTPPSTPPPPGAVDGPPRPTAAQTAPAPDLPTRPAQGSGSATPLRLRYHAISDVGRVRKDNQDSGYAGPWLLAVCDGVGGAARGDIASGTAITELRRLDEAPGGGDLITRVTDALHEAHASIGSQVDEDPALNGTSTTATVALFDGRKVAIAHIGDSRGYLLRDGELSQLTTDHTLVQSLIDEGRITEEEARVHPHRNLILKALDGLHEVEPDLFSLELVPGDRLFLCSDGASGVLEPARMAGILGSGSPEFCAIELVRASLDAGSSDNITCIVADVLSDEDATADPAYAELQPMVVGAAADLKKRQPRALFRGHRSGDTGELEPVDAEIPEGLGHAIRADPPVDPETYRYMPRPPRRFTWARRLLAAAIVLGLLWVLGASAYWWTQQQYYVGEHDGQVVIYRGVEGVPGLSELHRTSDIAVDQLPEPKQVDVDNGIAADDYDDAVDILHKLAEDVAPAVDPG